MKLSVVIPSWNEVASIGAAVESARSFADEVIVADAGSPDGTAERAAAAGAIVVIAPKGRGHQLRAGAARASGDVFLFLHADVTLPAGARRAVEQALVDTTIVGGNFRLRFEPASFAAHVFTAANDVRRRLFRIYYGDSAIVSPARGPVLDEDRCMTQTLVRGSELSPPTAAVPRGAGARSRVRSAASARLGRGEPGCGPSIWGRARGICRAASTAGRE